MEMASLTQKQLREKFFHSTDYHRIPGGRKKLEFLFSVLMERRAIGRQVSVLDVGCGNGGIAFAVASLGCEVLGVDVNEASISHARKTNRYPNARFEVVADRGFDLKKRYDLIICSDVLEHLFNPQRLLNTMARHLKDNGVLLITVPNGYGPREVLGRTEAFIRTKLGLAGLVDRARTAMGVIDAAEKCAVHTSNPDQDHVQKFTMRGLGELVTKAGLCVVKRMNSIFILSVALRGKSRIMDSLDARLADYLPPWVVSGWYVLCGRAVASEGHSGRSDALARDCNG